jgi:hypothetical protein
MILNTVTQTVVETVVIQEEINPTTVIVTSDFTEVIVAVNEPGPQGAKGLKGDNGNAAPLSTLTDVDTTLLDNGSILVYSTNSQKWVSTTLLENQSVESGHY